MKQNLWSSQSGHHNSSLAQIFSHRTTDTQALRISAKFEG